MRREQTVAGAPVDRPASLQLPADARSARRARVFVGEYCTANAVPGEVRRTASLLVSELVTNAILHARSTATVEIGRRADGVVRVAVADDSPGRPAVDLQPGPRAEGGRGLLIVSMLAARWGVDALVGGGKSVWFELQG